MAAIVVWNSEGVLISKGVAIFGVFLSPRVFALLLHC